MPSLGSLLLLALIFVTIGFIGGALVSLLWVTHDQEEVPSTESQEKSTSPVGDVDEVVSILRDQTNQNLILRVGKDLYRNSAQLSDQKRNTLEKVAVYWISWLRSSTEQSTEPLPRNEFILTTETESRLAQVTTSVELTEGKEKSSLLETSKKDVVNQKTSQESKKILSQPIMSNVVQGPQKLGKEVEIVQPKSIVVQIDDILQEMISKIEDAPKGVRLMEDPKGGVIVWVGAEKYLGIDMVSDTSIQNLIRSAVAEWEKRAVN